MSDASAWFVLHTRQEGDNMRNRFIPALVTLAVLAAVWLSAGRAIAGPDTAAARKANIGKQDTPESIANREIQSPASLKDFITVSVCNTYLLNLTPALLEKLQNKEPDIETNMILIDQAHSSASNSLCSGTFYSIPQGMHTYVFTCRLFVSSDASNRLWFNVGDQQLGPDKQTKNTATNEISLIFTYQPKDQYSNYLSIGAYLKPNVTQSTYARGISFWYMQLV